MPSAPGLSTPRRNRWLVTAAVLSAVWYLALASNAGVRELAAMLVVAGAATAVSRRVARCAGLRLDVRGGDLAQLWRLPGYLVVGTGEVILALWHQLFTSGGAASDLAVCPFDIGDRQTPAEAGRRALAIFYTTATPNFIVLGLLDQDGTMLYHQVKPGPVLTITRRLGAGPGPHA